MERIHKTTRFVRYFSLDDAVLQKQFSKSIYVLEDFLYLCPITNLQIKTIWK